MPDLQLEMIRRLPGVRPICGITLYLRPSIVEPVHIPTREQDRQDLVTYCTQDRPMSATLSLVDDDGVWGRSILRSVSGVRETCRSEARADGAGPHRGPSARGARLLVTMSSTSYWPDAGRGAEARQGSHVTYEDRADTCPKISPLIFSVVCLASSQFRSWIPPKPPVVWATWKKNFASGTSGSSFEYASKPLSVYVERGVRREMTTRRKRSPHLRSGQLFLLCPYSGTRPRRPGQRTARTSRA